MNGMRPEGWTRSRSNRRSGSDDRRRSTGMGVHRGLTIETTLDPAVQPFLYDHQIEGTPVLPGVMGIEAFAEAALRVLPGWHVEAVEDVNFLAPFKFYKNEPRTVTIEAEFHPEGDAVVADCRLTGRRMLPNQAEPQVTTHFTARVRLTQQAPVAVDRAAPPGSAGRAGSGSRRHLSPLLPRARLPGCGAGVARRRPDRRPDGGQSARQPPSAGAPAVDGAALDRALLSDRRAVGNRRARPHGPAATSGPRHGVARARSGRRSAICRGHSQSRMAAPSTRTSSIRRASAVARLSGYRTVTFRENVAADTFEALRDRSAMMAMADD